MGKAGLCELSYADEASFAANTNTFTKRIPFIGEVRDDLPDSRMSDGSMQTSSYERRPGYLGSRSGGFIEFDTEIPGANANTESGALDATHWFYKLLSDGWGGGNAASVGGALSGVPTTTSLPYSSGTPVSGAIIRVGQKYDGGGDGQAAVVNAVGSPMTLFNALPAAPSSGHKYRASLMMYPTETLGTTKRFLKAHLDTGAQYIARGCQLENITIRASEHGMVPRATWRYAVAYWDETTLSVPQVSTVEACNAHMMGGGSHVLQTVGTTTRNTEDVAEVEISLGFTLSPKPGMGVFSRQHIIGWERMPGPEISLRLTVPYVKGTRQTQYLADGSDTTHLYYLSTLSAGEGSTETEGRHVSIFCPRIYPARTYPRLRNFMGQSYMDLFYEARLGTDTTNELTKSPIRIGLS